MAAIFDTAIFIVLGATLSVIGRWGAHNTADLIRGALPPEEQNKRERVLRRGSVTCQIIGACFVVASAVRLLV